ncbi:hypothetical protein GJ496_008893 [Pomphorhynchus laevis]|nr:hypothetical protein GJ496_008893 [Pomphorhynchus laevis]
MCQCSASNILPRAYSYPREGLHSMMHDMVCDLFERNLTEICNNVQIEPTLRQLIPRCFSQRCIRAASALHDLQFIVLLKSHTNEPRVQGEDSVPSVLNLVQGKPFKPARIGGH